MPALNPIAVDDREDTPVTHTFTPAGDDQNGVHHFREGSGVPVGDNKLTVALNRNGNGYIRPRVRLQTPVTGVSTVDGISRTVVLRELSADVRFTFPGDSTPQERKNIVEMTKNLLSETESSIDGLLVDVEDLY